MQRDRHMNLLMYVLSTELVVAIVNFETVVGTNYQNDEKDFDSQTDTQA